MRVPNLFLRIQFEHSILVGQCNTQCKGSAINRTIKISNFMDKKQDKTILSFRQLFEGQKFFSFSIESSKMSIKSVQTFENVLKLFSNCPNVLAKKVPFHPLFGVPFHVASKSLKLDKGRAEKKKKTVMSKMKNWILTR